MGWFGAVLVTTMTCQAHEPLAKKAFLQRYDSIGNTFQGIISIEKPTNFLLLGLCSPQDTQHRCRPNRPLGSQALLDQTQTVRSGAHSR